MRVALRCTVRNCDAILRAKGPRFVCARDHSFDRHRSGYLNLLQPQDRRSLTPGDSKDAALARRRLAEKGLTDGLHQTFAHAIRGISGKPDSALLDVGCGEGAFLRFLSSASPSATERHGLDISPATLELAAKASRDVLFTAANADRFIPYKDRSFDVITSIDARTNESEFKRLLKPGGLLLVAVPAPDDLIELRERVQGARMEKPRSARVEESLGSAFALVERTVTREQRSCTTADLNDLLASTYRGFRQSEREAVSSLATMNVTLSHDVLTFRSLRS